MGENVPVRCPGCNRDHTFKVSVYPCACGAPVSPPLLRDAPPQRVTHRTWTDEWVKVRCTACGRQGHWPQPELGCPCGSVLRIPVRPVNTSTLSTLGGGPGQVPAPPADRTTAVPVARRTAAPRPVFLPVTIRTARDAVTTAALYLRWLGFHGVLQAHEQPASGIDLRGPEVIARVDPHTSPSTVRAVECLWLHGLNASAVSVFFSLAGYTDEALTRAEGLGVPLFVLDLTGAPVPVNPPADELLAAGA